MSDPHSPSESSLPDSSTPAFGDALPAGADAPPREGLPRSFRMRADAHYVDLLDAPAPAFRIELVQVSRIDARERAGAAPSAALVESIRRHGVLQPLLVQARSGRYRVIAGDGRLAAAVAAGIRELPCVVRHVDDEVAAELMAASNTRAAAPAAGMDEHADALAVAAGASLGRSLTALGTCAHLLADAPTTFTQGVAMSLVRAEAARAAGHLQALRLARGELQPSPRPVSVQALVARALEEVEPERRLRGVAVARRITVPDTCVRIDQGIFVGALSGALAATLALVDGIPGAQITLAADMDGDGILTCTVAQQQIGAPEDWKALAAGKAPADLTRSQAAALLVVRRLVEACEGRFSLTAAAPGTEIQLAVAG